MISMKNLRISSRQGAKVGCQGPPCTDCIINNGDMKLSIVEVPPGPQEARGELGQMGSTVFKVLYVYRYSGSFNEWHRTNYSLAEKFIQYFHSDHIKLSMARRLKGSSM